jgi:protein TonB
MNARATPSRPSGLHHRPVAPLALALLLGLGLAACGKEEEAAAPAAATGTEAAPAAVEAAPAVAAPDPNETPEQIATRADAAVDAQRLFAPPGDNAFELYLRVLEATPDQPLARNALTDLFPYAVMHVEQRLGANDPDDAERVLALMEKANPEAPALPRLRTAVTESRDRIAATEAAEEQRAEREAAAAAAAAQAAAAPAPAPVAAPPPRQVASATPPPAQAEPAPVEAPTPAPEQAAPAPAPRRVGGVPPVASQVQPRYPSVAFRRKIEGYVEVQFTVLADGSVTDVSVVRSDPRNTFDREAVNAMQKWKFQAVPGAEPVTGRRVFDFKLQ